MNTSVTLELLVTGIGVICIPTLIMLAKGASRWARTETHLETLIGEVRQLVQDKDKTHEEMLEQMRVDRDATDRRLRFMEEWYMRRGLREEANERYSNS